MTQVHVKMILNKWPLFCALLSFTAVLCEDYNIQKNDGSYEFGYDNPDSFHHSKANRNNVVRGEFGGRNPKTGSVDVTQYTAGPRGYRPRGKNIVRKFDQNQNGPRPIGSRDDPYFDPNEDPSYNFGFKTRTYSRKEGADRAGTVKGQYSYVDDVGERHNVQYTAGRRTGFHVETPFPDSNPRAYGPLYFNGRGKPLPRGRTSIQRGTDGSYRFVSAGPDQRRTETSDANGNVRGSYTYLDDKGVQHSVHYIAGPQIGYRVLKNVKGAHLPSVYPFSSSGIIPPDFYNYLDVNSNTDVLNVAEGTRPRPGDSDFDSGAPIRPRPSRPPKPSYIDDGDYDSDISDNLFGTGGSSTATGGDGIFGGGGSISTSSGSSSTTNRPPISSSTPSSGDDYDDGSYNPDYDDSDLFGVSKPKPRPVRPTGGPTRPSGVRPSPLPVRPKPDYDDDDDDGGDLFGTGGVSSSTRPPIIGIGSTVSGSSSGDKKHTIVTNLGTTIFTVPPGVSVKAHVQSIDLFPYESKVPSPSDQYRAETSNIKERKAATESSTVTAPIQSTTEELSTVK